MCHRRGPYNNNNNNNNNMKIYNAHMYSSIKHESETWAVARWPDGVC